MLKYNMIENWYDKIGKVRECNIYHCLYFLKKNLSFPSKTCNGYHHIRQISMGFDDIEVSTVGRNY